MTETAAAHAGSTDPTARRGVAAATDRWSRLVDHSWLLLGDRDNDVLFCVAGSLHTTDQVAGCAYWIRTTLAERLRRLLPDAGRQEAAGASPLHYDGATYVKLPALAPPPAWPAVYAALGHLGVRPVEASLLAVAQLAVARGILDPRHAVRAAAALPGHGHDCGLRVLHQLLTAIGDPAGTSGVLGLTGSAAFDPGRLCDSGRNNHDAGTDATDVDLLIYGSGDPARLPSAEVLVQAGISALGGVRLADLPAVDPRRVAYGGSRLFPAGRPGQHRDRLWARRRDVAWIGGVRLDLTLVPPAAYLVDELPYTAAVARPVAAMVQVDSVSPGYPTRLSALVDGRPVEIWVTARGFDGALQRRWHREYYRAECRDAALELDGDQIRIHRRASTPETIAVPANHPRHGHRTVLAEFADWLRGGPPATTCLTDNLRSVAAVFAARDAAATAHLTALLPQPPAQLELATGLQ